MTRGELQSEPLLVVLSRIAQEHATGALQLVRTGLVAEEGHVYVHSGQVYAASAGRERFPIGARLVTAYGLPQAALEEALHAQTEQLQGWRLGEILVHLGHVEPGTIEEASREQLLDALTDMSGWDSGSWRFRIDERTRTMVSTALPWGEVAALVSARQEEWLELLPVVHGAHAVPLPVAVGMDVALDPVTAALLSRIDGVRTVAEVAHDRGLSVLETGRALAGLSAAGAVRIGDGQSGGSAMAMLDALSRIDPDEQVEDLVAPVVDLNAARQARAADEAARVQAKRDADDIELAEAARRSAEAAAAAEAERAALEAQARAEAAAALEAERVAALEAERVAAEEAERVAAEAERVAAEAVLAEAARVEAEQAAALEAERLAAEQAAAEEAFRLAAIEAERAAAERDAAERAEFERHAAEQAAAAEAERHAAERAAHLAAQEAERAAEDAAARARRAEVLEAERAAQRALEEEAEAFELSLADQLRSSVPAPSGDSAELAAALAAALDLPLNPAIPVQPVDTHLPEPVVDEPIAAPPAWEPSEPFLEAFDVPAPSEPFVEAFEVPTFEPSVEPAPEPEPVPAAAASAPLPAGMPLLGTPDRPIARSGEADMASLFRELSSLGDDDPPAAPRPAAHRPPPPGAVDPKAKKKKGLFGR